jgi:hypothetical protein
VNRRSAIAVAGGLTGALVSGVAGYSVRVHQPPPAAADPAGKPIVRTKTRTITIHKKAKPRSNSAAAPVRTVVVKRAPTVIPAPAVHASTSVVHHTGGSATGGGEGDDRRERGDHEGGGGDD